MSILQAITKVTPHVVVKQIVYGYGLVGMTLDQLQSLQFGKQFAAIKVA